MLCPKCGKEIANNSNVCPSCGVNTINQPPPQISATAGNKPKKKYTGLIIGIIIAVVVFMLLGCCIIPLFLGAFIDDDESMSDSSSSSIDTSIVSDDEETTTEKTTETSASKKSDVSPKKFFKDTFGETEDHVIETLATSEINDNLTYESDIYDLKIIDKDGHYNYIVRGWTKNPDLIAKWWTVMIKLDIDTGQMRTYIKGEYIESDE